MKGALNNIFTYKSSPTIQKNLYTTFLDMKTTSSDPSFFEIKTWGAGDKPLEIIHLHEGLVATGAVNTIATLNGHTLTTLSKAEAAPADELKEAINH